MQMSIDRRFFLNTSIAATAAALWKSPSTLQAAQTSEELLPIRKTLKIGMIGAGATLTEKFKIAKQAGFQGIEIDSPGANTDDIRRAIDESGLPVDGSVCSTHWNVRHTDPDPKVREQALNDLLAAIRQTHAVGGHTTLLVIGRGADGNLAELNERSVANIWKAIPVAAELGVAIAIENVWNQYLYQHDGPNTQTADAFAQYVDQFESPWVGMQFDIGNHWKYGNPADWIRTLGKRIVKLDIKDFSRADNEFRDITHGDIPWSEVRQALRDIKFHGWCAAEVGGGDLAKLTQIAKEMDNALMLA